MCLYDLILCRNAQHHTLMIANGFCATLRAILFLPMQALAQLFPPVPEVIRND
jgi:hypothetical protein